MDRKSIIVLVLCFVLLMCWHWLVDRIYPPKPLPPGVTNSIAASFTATNQGSTSAVAPPAPEANVVPAPTPLTTTHVPEELLEITNANAHYTFTSYGGGLKLVELLQYPETVSTRREHRSNRVATLDTFTPAPTLAILGGEGVEGDGIFKLTRAANGVRAEKSLTNCLNIVKDFEVSTN